MNGDVALPVRPARGDTAEMRVDRGGVVAFVGSLETHPAGEERVAARGVQHETRRETVFLAIRAGRGHCQPSVRSHGCQIGDARSLHRAGAKRARVGEQHRVELGPPHLIGVAETGAQGVGEGKGGTAPGLIGDELGAGLQHAKRVDLILNAQTLEDLQVARQQGLADVEARMRLLLQHQHVASGTGQQRRGGRTGGSAADHQHVAGFDCFHGRRVSNRLVHTMSP